MNLIKPLVLLLSCLSLHYCLCAQSNDLEGYYISPKGDTIFGKFTNYVDYQRNPSKVQFQPSSAPAIALTPVTCLKFSVRNSDTYISYTGERMLNGTNYQEADKDTADKFENIVVFLRELFNDGHYRLYELNDRKRNNFYISEGDGPLTELYFKEYEISDRVISSDAFRQQLTALFGNSLLKNPELAAYIEKMRFDPKDMVDVFTVLTGKKQQNTKSKSPLQIFIGAGVTVNSFNVVGDPTQSDNEVGSYSSQVTPIFEVGVKLYSQRNRGRLFWIGRVNYYKYQNFKTFDYVYWSYKTTFNASMITVPLTMGYRIVSGKLISIEPAVGMRTAFLSNNFQTQVASTGFTTVTDNAVSFAFQAFGELALTIKKRVSFVADYYFPLNTGTYMAYSANHSSFTYGLRYFIF